MPPTPGKRPGPVGISPLASLVCRGTRDEGPEGQGERTEEGTRQGIRGRSVPFLRSTIFTRKEFVHSSPSVCPRSRVVREKVVDTTPSQGEVKQFSTSSETPVHWTDGR